MHGELKIYADYKGLMIEIYGDVISPGQESVEIEKCLSEEEARFANGIVIGCGAGLLALSMVHKVDSVSFTDINASAVSCCRQNFSKNLPSVSYKSAVCDLAAEFDSKLFDIVLCNPPQLPSITNLDNSHWAVQAHEGGISGRVVLFAMILEAKRLFRDENSKLIVSVFGFHLDKTIEFIIRNGLNYNIRKEYTRKMGAHSVERKSLWGGSEDNEFQAYILEVRANAV